MACGRLVRAGRRGHWPLPLRACQTGDAVYSSTRITTYPVLCCFFRLRGAQRSHNQDFKLAEMHPGDARETPTS